MEIPLFPLPNLVLFPQVAVPLHIFEERYKLMINRCIDQADIFGLVLLNEEADQENEDSILRVGVSARVVQVDRLDEGRLNVLCAGESRFRILEFTGSAPYWTADVEFFDDDPETEEGLQEAYQRVSILYRKATELTSQLKDMEIPQLDLPDSPVALSYMVSYVLDLGAARKQELLEATSTLFRLRSLVEDLETAISQLQGHVARKGLAHKAIRNGDLGKPGSRSSLSAASRSTNRARISAGSRNGRDVPAAMRRSAPSVRNNVSSSRRAPSPCRSRVDFNWAASRSITASTSSSRAIGSAKRCSAM